MFAKNVVLFHACDMFIAIYGDYISDIIIAHAASQRCWVDSVHFGCMAGSDAVRVVVHPQHSVRLRRSARHSSSQKSPQDWKA